MRTSGNHYSIRLSGGQPPIHDQEPILRDLRGLLFNGFLALVTLLQPNHLSP